MNLHALKLFYETAALGSVTKAAEALRISQPAVTAQIRKLEQELSLALLEPKGRGIRLTEAGTMLYAYASRLFALEASMEAALDDYRSGRTGRVRVAATSLPAHQLLPVWMATFLKQQPAVEMELITVNSSSAMERLLHYQADLAIIGGSPAEHPGITVKELLQDELIFIVSASHELAGKQVTFAEMMKVPFVLREPGSFAREALFSLCRLHGAEPPRAALQLTGLSESIRSVAAGFGAAFVSALEVSEPIRRGEVCRVLVKDCSMSNSIALCTRSDRLLSPASSLFVEYILAQP
jgi:DNA-binding transcriptional LysR family regulator